MTPYTKKNIFIFTAGETSNKFNLTHTHTAVNPYRCLHYQYFMTNIFSGNTACTNTIGLTTRLFVSQFVQLRPITFLFTDSKSTKTQIETSKTSAGTACVLTKFHTSRPLLDVTTATKRNTQNKGKNSKT